MSSTSAKTPDDREPLGSWASIFQRNREGVFLLSARRRLRYVNSAWEKITGFKSKDVIGEYCHPRKQKNELPVELRAILQAMAPLAEAISGRSLRVRRPFPPGKLGPPWWDLTFVPLHENNRLIAIIGFISTDAIATTRTASRGLSEPLIGLRERLIEAYSLTNLFSNFPTHEMLLSRIELAAITKSPIWISGEAGTGKETLARCVHYHGITREKSFVAIDCAGLQPYLIRSLLFGHNGIAGSNRTGTILFKAPQFMPADLQMEILDWYAMTDDAPRIAISALPEVKVQAAFRATFGVIPFAMPRLSDHSQEIQNLWHDQLLAVTGKPDVAIDIDQSVHEAVTLWKWPGNLRELKEVSKEVIERSEGKKISLEHLPLIVRRNAFANQNGTKQEPDELKLDEVLEKVESRMIDLALKRTKGDQTAAAQLLGIHRNRLLRRLKALGIEDSK